MAKQLTFSYKGKDYTLEYTRRTVRQMEDSGFIAGDVGDKPMQILRLFSGAFLAHHRSVKPDVIEDIYEHLPHKEQLIEKLVEMYNEPIAALLEEPEEGDEGNVIWTASWGS